VQLPLFTPPTDWTATPVSDLPSWADAKRVAVDVETKDSQLKTLGPGVRRPEDYMVGVSFAIEDGPAHYLPFRHEGGDNLDPEHVLAYMRDQAKGFKGTLVGANLGYDLDWLAQEGVEFRAAWYRDVLLAAPVVNELHDSYTLDAVARRCGFEGKATKLLLDAADAYGLDPYAGLWRLPGRYVGIYGAEDSHLPLKVLRRLEREIDEQGLWKVWDLESRVLPCTVAIRRRGIAIDFDQVERNEARFLQVVQESLKVVKDATGVAIEPDEVWNASTLAPALEKLGVVVPLTPETKKPSIKESFLTQLHHPVADALIRARKFRKAGKHYVTRVRDFEINGRIHPTFNQMRKTDDSGNARGAAFGRFSCTDPNLQQVPSRDPEIGPYVRAQYIADDGCELLRADYSQQEPRHTAHLGEVLGIEGADVICNLYRENPDMDNHQMMADLTGLPRKQAKNVFLAMVYGMGGAKLCMQLGLPSRWLLIVKNASGRRHNRYRASQAEAAASAKAYKLAGFAVERVLHVAGEEGQEIISRFYEKVPFVKELAKHMGSVAQRFGYITTEGGRRCRFPELEDGKFDWTFKALNRRIQGSSADQMKTAVVDAEDAGLGIQLLVHDEAVMSVADRSEGALLTEIMVQAMPLRVPSKVEPEYGQNWGFMEAA